MGITRWKFLKCAASCAAGAAIGGGASAGIVYQHHSDNDDKLKDTLHAAVLGVVTGAALGPWFFRRSRGQAPADTPAP